MKRSTVDREKLSPMMKEYVKTKKGYIGKVTDVEKAYGGYYLDCMKVVSRTNMIRHEKKLIKLIEEGDYVNGHLIVNEIYGEDDNELYFEIEGGFNKAKYIGEKDIKSIVTKEQFNSMKYEV